MIEPGQPCANCQRPMTTERSDFPGVLHRTKGLCNRCYNHRKKHGALPNYPPRLSVLLQRPAAWMDDALCAQIGVHEAFDPWFPEGGLGGHGPQEGQRICRRCTVRLTCLEYADAQGEHGGTWGGLSENERREIRNRKRKGAA